VGLPLARFSILVKTEGKTKQNSGRLARDKAEKKRAPVGTHVGRDHTEK